MNPYLEEPGVYESVQQYRVAGPAVEHFPERWLANAAYSHLHTHTPFSNKTAICHSLHSVGSGYPSTSYENTWKWKRVVIEAQNDILQVILQLANNILFNVLQNNEHLFRKIVVFQFIIVDAIRVNSTEDKTCLYKAIRKV